MLLCNITIFIHTFVVFQIPSITKRKKIEWDYLKEQFDQVINDVDVPEADDIFEELDQYIHMEVALPKG